MNISLLSGFLHLFFPEVCVVCGNGLLHGEKCLCMKCLLNMPLTHNCEMESNKTTELFAGRFPFCKAASYFNYHKGSAFTNIIHALKYENREEIGVFMGKMFASELKDIGFSNTIDLIVPVPLHQKRHKERGYNQSNSIALGMSEILSIPINTSSVIRSIYTNTQTRKDKIHRYENVNQIFKLLDPTAFENKHILLIDDVITTGATIESLAMELVSVNNITISIASLAIANYS